MKTFLFSLLLVLCGSARAQVTKGTLQASGLTCSMCSKAVKNALDKVSFIERVQVDIKNQQYTIYFKEGSQVDLDAVSKAVENAGFSVARLVVTAAVNGLKLEKEAHIKIGDFYFHILNATDQQLNGETTLTIVDKGFVSAKEFKKYSSWTRMPCIKTGRVATCCPSPTIPENARIYHAVI